MALYGTSVTTIAGSPVNHAIADVKAPLTTGTKLMEIAIVNPTGAFNILHALVGRSTTELFQSYANYVSPYDASDKASTTSVGLAWSIAPVVPTQFFRRAACASQAGTGIIWSFPRGIAIASSQSIVVWNTNAGGTMAINISVEVDE